MSEPLLVDDRFADAFRHGLHAERRALGARATRDVAARHARMHAANADHFTELANHARGRAEAAQDWLARYDAARARIEKLGS